MKTSKKLNILLLTALLGSVTPFYSPVSLLVQAESSSLQVSDFNGLKTALENGTGTIFLEEGTYTIRECLEISQDTIIKALGPITLALSPAEGLFELSDADLILSGESQKNFTIVTTEASEADVLIKGAGNLDLDHCDLVAAFKAGDQKAIDIEGNLSLKQSSIELSSPESVLGLKAMQIDMQDCQLQVISSSDQASAIDCQGMLMIQNSSISSNGNTLEYPSIKTEGYTRIASSQVINQASGSSIGLLASRPVQLMEGSLVQAGGIGLVLDGFGTSQIGQEDEEIYANQVVGGQIAVYMGRGALKVSAGTLRSIDLQQEDNTSAALVLEKDAHCTLDKAIVQGIQKAIDLQDQTALEISCQSLFSPSVANEGVASDSDLELEVSQITLFESENIFDPDLSYYSYWKKEDSQAMLNAAFNLMGAEGYHQQAAVVRSLAPSQDDASAALKFSAGNGANTYWNILIESVGSYLLPDENSGEYLGSDLLASLNGLALQGWSEQPENSGLIEQIDLAADQNLSLRLYGNWTQSTVKTTSLVDHEALRPLMDYQSNSELAAENFTLNSGLNTGFSSQGAGFTQNGSQTLSAMQLMELISPESPLQQQQLSDPSLQDYTFTFTQSENGIKNLTVQDNDQSVILIILSIPAGLNGYTIVDLGTNTITEQPILADGASTLSNGAMIRALLFDQPSVRIGIPMIAGSVDYATTAMIDNNGELFSNRLDVSYPESSLLEIPNLTSLPQILINNSRTFKDVPQESPYYNGVEFMSARDLMHGTASDPDLFDVDGLMYRATFAQLLYNYAGNPEIPADQIPSEVQDQWYAQAAAYVMSEGLMASGSSFDGESPLTREQLCMILWRLCAQPQADLSVLENYSDTALISAGFEQPVAWAASIGLIGQGSLLMPDFYATRGQTAKIYTTLLQYLYQ